MSHDHAKEDRCFNAAEQRELRYDRRTLEAVVARLTGYRGAIPQPLTLSDAWRLGMQDALRQVREMMQDAT